MKAKIIMTFLCAVITVQSFSNDVFTARVVDRTDRKGDIVMFIQDIYLDSSLCVETLGFCPVQPLQPIVQSEKVKADPGLDLAKIVEARNSRKDILIDSVLLYRDANAFSLGLVSNIPVVRNCIRYDDKKHEIIQFTSIGNDWCVNWIVVCAVSIMLISLALIIAIVGVNFPYEADDILFVRVYGNLLLLGCITTIITSLVSKSSRFSAAGDIYSYGNQFVIIIGSLAVFIVTTLVINQFVKPFKTTRWSLLSTTKKRIVGMVLLLGCWLMVVILFSLQSSMSYGIMWNYLPWLTWSALYSYKFLYRGNGLNVSS